MINYIKIIKIFLFLISIIANFSVVYAFDNEKKVSEKQIEEKESLEYEKKDIKKDIKKVKEEKKYLQKKLNSQYIELSSKKKKISQIEYQVQAKENLIEQNEKEVNRLKKEQYFQKTVLKSVLRKLYYYSGIDDIEVFNRNDTQFFSAQDDLGMLRNKANNIFKNLEILKKNEQNKKEETLNAKKEKEKLLLIQKYQEKEIKKQAFNIKTKVEMADITISQLNSKLSSVESSLSALLGNSFNTNDIVKSAKFASEKTGVRKDFILGMLTQETSLGRFTGGCTYDKSRMGNKNKKIFKRITKDLGYNYKNKKVSCPLSYGIGGAMGVSQFMPTTWVYYEKDVSKYTGHSPADPWSLTDGVMAMAIKLKRDGASSKNGEFDAARRYYCGSNIERKVCVNYANSVLYWTDNYKRLLR